MINLDLDAIHRAYIVGIENAGTLRIKDNSEVNVGTRDEKKNTKTGIRGVGTSHAEIENSKITVLGGNIAYGVYTQEAGSVVDIVSGNMNVEGATTSYGAYINLGTFIMGHLEGTGIESSEVSNTNPRLYVEGSSRGIGVKKVNG